MYDFELAVCASALEGWEVWWYYGGVGDITGVAVRVNGRREDFSEGRPHAAPSSGAECDVGVAVSGGECEKWTDGCAVDVK